MILARPIKMEEIKAKIKGGNHTLGIMCDGLGFYVECLNIAAPDRISPFDPEALKYSEVKGNIYENKGLLEVEE